MRALPLALLLWACGPAKPSLGDDEAPDTDTGSTDSASDTDTAADTDTDPGQTPALGEACEPADLHFGDPDDNDIFECSECHEHDHFTGYAVYELLAADGSVAPELSFANNVMEVPVDVPHPADEPPVTDDCVTYGYGEHRNCGWEIVDTFHCEPGEEVTLACENACSGRCWSDTTMRVCEGENVACRGADALVHNDDGCGGTCSADSFDCPPSGVVTALVSSRASYDRDSCTIVVL